ncbi:MAG: methyltransferase domain-containing protein [Myxococcota bacterium]
MPTYTYDEKFFEYTNAVSARSADAIVPLVYEALAPNSILDLGCGCGVWLSRWMKAGATDALGVDGDYIDPRALEVPRANFMASDLSSRIDLGRKFDLAQSLEVAEHLPESRAGGFVADLCGHADVVLFGAAPPGQGGENHVNEQPYDYWRAHFASQGFDAYDFVRPLVVHDDAVAPWHRYNPVLYVRDDLAASLPENIARTRVPAHESIKDLSPPAYRARKAIIRQLPAWATDALANVRKRIGG